MNPVSYDNCITLIVALGAGAVARLTVQKEDASMAAFYLISLSIGVMMVSLRGSSVDLMHVLFGTVLALNDDALWLIGLVTCVTLVPDDRRTVVVAHNAFRYFEVAYGIRFLLPQGVSTESEAAAADVAGSIPDTGAAAIFAENISDTRLLERIAAEAGLTLAGTLYSDALSGAESPAPTYLAMMRHNAGVIAAALDAR